VRPPSIAEGAKVNPWTPAERAPLDPQSTSARAHLRRRFPSSFPAGCLDRSDRRVRREAGSQGPVGPAGQRGPPGPPGPAGPCDRSEQSGRSRRCLTQPTTTAAACRWKSCAWNGATPRALTGVDQKLEHRDFAVVVVGASYGASRRCRSLALAETKTTRSQKGDGWPNRSHYPFGAARMESSSGSGWTIIRRLTRASPSVPSRSGSNRSRSMTGSTPPTRTPVAERPVALPPEKGSARCTTPPFWLVRFALPRLPALLPNVTPALQRQKSGLMGRLTDSRDAVERSRALLKRLRERDGG
jgi:hypothetical protein